MPLFEGGILRNYYIDTYYGRKLGMKPTTGGGSNLAWKLGSKDADALFADVKEGVYVTGSASDPVPSPVRRWQHEVHRPGIYDLEVDTSRLTPQQCAEAIRGDDGELRYLGG